MLHNNFVSLIKLLYVILNTIIVRNPIYLVAKCYLSAAYYAPTMSSGMKYFFCCKHFKLFCLPPLLFSVASALTLVIV